jgi:uncharacterized protein YbjT (DUF2867 family)
MEYLITGATGNVGSLVVNNLVRRGIRPRILVRDPRKATERFGKTVDIFVGDLADAATLKDALKGTNVFLLITSGPDLARQDDALAKAARSAHVGHLVKLSSFDAREQNIGTGVWHANGERAIRATGIDYTFVQPSGFMSNALYWANSIKSAGVVRTATGDGKIPFIHPQDIADVTTEVLVSGKHRGTSLPITGPESLTYAEMAAKLAIVIGKPIRFEAISEAEARRQQQAWGADPDLLEARLSIFRAIREGRLDSVTNVVEQVLGRQAITFDQWASENADAFR